MINKGFFFFFFVFFLQRATGKRSKDEVDGRGFFRRLINRLVAAIAVVGKHMKTAA